MHGSRKPASSYLPSVLSCLQRDTVAGAGQRPYLVQGDDEEGPPTGALSHDRNEVGVHGAKVVVVDAVGDGH